MIGNNEFIESLKSGEINVEEAFFGMSRGKSVFKLNDGRNIFVYGELDLAKDSNGIIFYSDTQFIRYVNGELPDDIEFLEESALQEIENSDVCKAIAESIIRYANEKETLEVLFEDMPVCKKGNCKENDSSEKDEVSGGSALSSDSEKKREKISAGDIMEKELCNESSCRVLSEKYESKGISAVCMK